MTAVILAAGGSTRAGVDKVTADLGGEPVLAWSLAAVAAARVFDDVIVVAPPGREESVREIVGPRARVARVIAGGATRTDSSWAALDAAEGAEVLAIHDAARPFAPPRLFARLVEAAREHGSAVAGLQVADTVRRADGTGSSVEELSREGLWAAQTPQVFRADLLRRAREAAAGRSFSDDAAALAAAGLPVRMVRGEPRNLKITTGEDLEYARELVASGVVAIAALAIN